MQYRTDPKTNNRISALGLGCMRFPVTVPGRPDARAAETIIACAVERGINYLDTAYLYPGNEACVGAALERTPYPDGRAKPDALNEWFDMLEDRLVYRRWYFGHYHADAELDCRHRLLYRDIVLSVGNYQVSIKGKVVDLTQKEYEILKELMERPGIVISRESFLNRLWKYDFYGDERAVDNHIKNLRRKLGDAGNYIETVRGVGYRLEKLH